MKIRLLLLLLTSMFTHQLIAQMNSGEIEYRKSFWNEGFYQNNKRLSGGKLTKAFSINPTALAELNKARTNKAFSSFFAGLGGGFIGYPIGTAAGGGDPDWTFAAIGAGLVAIAIPFEIAFNKKAAKAIELYNSSIHKSSGITPQIRLGFTGHGLGIQLSL